MHNILLIFIFFYSSSVFSKGPSDGIREVFSICSDKGYSSSHCQSRLHGENRWMTALASSCEIRNRTEKKYNNFLDNYPTAFGLGVTKTNFRFNLDTKFNLNPKLNDVTDDDFIKDGKYWVLKEEAATMLMINDNGLWKLAFTDKAESLFKQSTMYKLHMVTVLRTNILNFHMAKAKIESPEKGALMDDVAYASIPLIIALKPEKIDEVRSLVKYTVQNIVDKYWHLNTEEAINKTLGD